jgi:hypothetical protein
METLFKEQKQTYRRSNGQFATREMAYADKQATDNKRLSFEVEKYKRMYLAVVKENSVLKRKFNEIKELLEK